MIKTFTPAETVHLGGWTFNKLCLQDMEMYLDYLGKTGYSTNVFSWNFTFVWAESRRRTVIWKIIDDMLVTFRLLKTGEIDLWSLPFGEGDLKKIVKVLHKSLRFCQNWNISKSSSAIVRVINSPQLEFLRGSEDFHRLFNVKKLKSIERVNGIDNLLTLHGKEFRSLRSKINQFTRSYPDAVVREYNHNDFNQLMQLQQSWNEQSGKKYKTIMDKTTYPEVLKNYYELNHLILVVEINGKIAGMISGDISPQGYAWSYFIKAVDGIRGIYETMQIELARKLRELNPNVQLLNVGSDLGKKGIAEFKEKFGPVERFERYTVSII